MQTATVRWIENQQFLATTPSGHAVAFDADRQRNSAPSPMEMLLAALGSCTATDIVLILQKKRQKLTSLVVSVSGERAPNPPTVWTKIEILYRLEGELDEKAVKDAVELSQAKYCGVSVTLGQMASISYRYEIVR
jgi:putative redox protein